MTLVLPKDQGGMGNLLQGGQKVKSVPSGRHLAQPPRDLSALLAEICRAAGEAQKCIWESQFRHYLRIVGREDLEAMLDFVIASHCLLPHHHQRKQRKPNVGYLPNKPDQDYEGGRVVRQRRILTNIGNRFFSESSPTPIPLSNQVLREDLVSCLHNLIADSGSSDTRLQQAIDLVFMARRDHMVWKGGLDAAYNRFVASKPAMPISTAVLMCLL